MEAISESMVIKLCFNNTIKRTRAIPSTLKELHKLISDTFPELSNTSFSISYQDKENDTILLTNEEDLQEAYLQLKEDNKNILKLCIKKNVECASNTLPDVKSNKDLAVHRGIICDCCEMTPIRGDRYKCLVCPGYDLCSSCHSLEVHSEHSFMKIKGPYENKMNNSQAIELNITPNTLPKVIDTLRTSCLNFHNPWGVQPPFQSPPYWHHPPPFHGQEQPFGYSPFFRPPNEGEGCRERMKDALHRTTCSFKRDMAMAIIVGGRSVNVECAPGEVVEAKWQFVNESNESWPENVIVMKRKGKCHIKGDIEFEPMKIKGGYKPNETIDLCIPITAPKEPGVYCLKLMLAGENGLKIGRFLEVNLKVEEIDPIFDVEGVITQSAKEMSQDGFGSFEKCYDALIEEKGDIKAARTHCKKH
jgi:hypothetical protein